MGLGVGLGLASGLERQSGVRGKRVDVALGRGVEQGLASGLDVKVGVTGSTVDLACGLRVGQGMPTVVERTNEYRFTRVDVD